VIHGHRGGFKPDNTLKGFQKAIEHGLEAIEIDVSFKTIKPHKVN
jgi:glycerophosphoryl diester phosphodiesterase